MGPSLVMITEPSPKKSCVKFSQRSNNSSYPDRLRRSVHELQPGSKPSKVARILSVVFALLAFECCPSANAQLPNDLVSAMTKGHALLIGVWDYDDTAW